MKDSGWYDMIYSENKNLEYEGSYKNNGDIIFWRDIVTTIKRNRFVFEIGCGVGQFAELLYEQGHDFYIGIDFSNVAIKKARSKNLGNFAFFCRDIDEMINLNADFVICLEVLEHLDNDIKMISNLVKGIRFIASVPNFESESHVRWFNNEEEIRIRYNDVLEIHSIKEYKFNERIIFVIDSITK